MINSRSEDLSVSHLLMLRISAAAKFEVASSRRRRTPLLLEATTVKLLEMTHVK